jgi:hypothetical protein
MMLVKANKDSEAGVMPSEKMLTEMGKFNEELGKPACCSQRKGQAVQGRARPVFQRRFVVDGLSARNSLPASG